ncbi:MAG TPA: tRNA (adenosine(37)-N6)-threonylcarbamoyltransferase complex dimerization subunit type 1 TsaB [Actinomycetes bacterium]|nr:tRNA (adenosine(37)-N6)-threonylcarbamoyltransferase complex dimerization subunit type 1 TsaB [Actinomycetes bacterium]
MLTRPTLALDTSTPALTVAVVHAPGGAGEAGAPVVLAAREVVDARRHAELLTPLIETTLVAAGVEAAALTRLVVGVGPGPFTGLRIGLMTASALGDALGVPVEGVCSLDALAVEARDAGIEGPLLVATDARRREIYWATYDETGRSAGPAVGRPADVLAELAATGWTGAVVGDGARLHAAVFAEAGIDVAAPWYPRAGDLVTALHRGAELLAPRPLYLRRPDAQVPGAPKPVLA